MTSRQQYPPSPAGGAQIRKREGQTLTGPAHLHNWVPVVYWSSSILLASAMLAGGLQQLFHTKRLVDLFAHLGYPSYLLYILGVWQVLGVIAILIPKFSLLKEWAYAGLFLMYTGAAASHFLVGDSVEISLSPVLFALTTIASWKLRPASRKLSTIESGEYSTSKAIWYWITTGLISFVFLFGGVWQLSNAQLLVHQNPPLGFPAYFWEILGLCKLLGGIGILVPRFPLAKEWAYAGIVFNMTGASAARAFTGASIPHIAAPLVICVVAMVSWKLRPESRSPN